MAVVYLDYNATTPADPRVIDAMMPWFRAPSNAGSRTHLLGQLAKSAIDTAREQVASVLGIGAEDIVFTSGATESDNIAILGLGEFGKRTGRTHVLSTAIEHKAVLEPLRRMSDMGFSVEYVPVSEGGWVTAKDVINRVRPDTLLVSVMHANNETGVLQPVEEIGHGLKKTSTLFHVDAAQTFGKELSLRNAAFDLLSISGHKIYGPQGIGALVVRRQKFDRRELLSLTAGGGQERGLRPGTVPVPLAVGIGKAAELALAEHEARRDHAEALKDQFLANLTNVTFEINGDLERSQPHVLNVSFTGVDSEALMMAMRDSVAISNGSACTSSQYAPSHVLKAMGMDEDRISSSVRISWGPEVQTIPAEIFTNVIASLQS